MEQDGLFIRMFNKLCGIIFGDFSINFGSSFDVDYLEGIKGSISNLFNQD